MIELRAHGGSSRTRTAPTATITPGGPHDTVAVEDAIEWLRNRPFYEGQIAGAPPSARPRAGVPRRRSCPRMADALAKDGDRPPLPAPGRGDRGGPRRRRRRTRHRDREREVARVHRARLRGRDGPRGRTLYVGPQNALIADQEESLSELAHGLGFGSGVSVESYTGRLSRARRSGTCATGSRPCCCRTRTCFTTRCCRTPGACGTGSSLAGVRRDRRGAQLPRGVRLAGRHDPAPARADLRAVRVEPAVRLLLGDD